MPGSSPVVTRGLDPRVHLLRKKFLRRGWIAGSSPAMTVFVVSRPMERHNNGYARPARKGIGATPPDIRRGGGGAASQSFRRVRGAAAEHDQRLCLWRHLEPACAAAQDKIARGGRYDGRDRPRDPASGPPQRRGP